MQKKNVNFVVTDLDDTIWDWLSMWYGSFQPYIQRLSHELAVPLKNLKESFKRLHQRYHTSEASFIYHELDCLSEEQKLLIGSSQSDRSILHEFYSNKKHNLSLYEGVFDTLNYIKSQGTRIVAFTESSSFYTKYRIKHLQLDGVIDCIYAPLDTNLPDSVLKYYPDQFWEPTMTEFRYLPRKIKKPDSEILEVILRDFNAKKEESIYVGDKLDRDIYMAQQLGVTSIWAKYGDKIDHTEYQLLKEVTHWTLEDIERENQFKLNYNSNPLPNYVLEKNYAELLNFFNFFTFVKM